ncbi:MAG: hypothetical protein IJ506_04440 [Clostridia bacterium]|nr:hypothetical protein [Clostridia bacterium]
MKNSATEKLERLFKEKSKEHKSFPFWSWNGDLDEKELVRQIEEMHRAGMGGFIMHARAGLKTEYLGEKWFSCVEACLNKAKSLKMDAWIYDENGYPSGFVGGKLLENEDFRARFLTYEVKPSFDKEAFAVYKKVGKSYERILGEQEGLGEYHCVYLGVSPANTDILNPAVVDAFIKETHEKYYARFSSRFGRELVGFFTDEPQYYRRDTPYSFTVAEEFEKNGEDVKDGLIWLFKREKEGYAFRVKYYRTLNKLFAENYYKKLYDWCEVHGCLLTGHALEETKLFMQMWGCAGVMGSYEYEHIPAIDSLHRRQGTEIAPKQVSSVAAQLGKKRVLTETFAGAGYDVTPRELKSIAEYQYFNGVNTTCQHLFPYTLSGMAKYDFPPPFSSHSNWLEEMREFNGYFAKLGCLIANTEEVCDAALLHPIQSAYLDYTRKEDGESVKELDEAFEEFLLRLRKQGVTYQLVDERILARHGKADGETLTVGNCRYNAVMLPPMKTIAKSTLEILKGYRGKLYAEGEIPFVDGEEAEMGLCPNTSFDELAKGARAGFFCVDGNCGVNVRRGEAGDFFFVKNYSSTESSRFTLKNAEAFATLDLETLALSRVEGETELPPHGSMILLKCQGLELPKSKKAETDCTDDFAVAAITENYLVMDFARVSKDGENWSERQNIQKIFDGLLKENYKGELYLRQSFVLNGETPLTLVMEKGLYEWVKVNGEQVVFRQNSFDQSFAEATLADLKIGENILEYKLFYYQHEGVHFALFDPMATESLVNCLYYDTTLNNAYLTGEFVVEKDLSLSPRRGYPALKKPLFEQGYPFFKGEIILRGKYVYDGKGKRSLRLTGKFLTAKIRANGKEVFLVLQEKTEITELLKEGENLIEIAVKSSVRNMLGPHHLNMEGDPTCIYPARFHFRGKWGEQNPPEYTDEYSFAPFGIDEILIEERK